MSGCHCGVLRPKSPECHICLLPFKTRAMGVEHLSTFHQLNSCSDQHNSVNIGVCNKKFKYYDWVLQKFNRQHAGCLAPIGRCTCPGKGRTFEGGSSSVNSSQNARMDVHDDSDEASKHISKDVSDDSDLDVEENTMDEVTENQRLDNLANDSDTGEDLQLCTSDDSDSEDTCHDSDLEVQENPTDDLGVAGNTLDQSEVKENQTITDNAVSEREQKLQQLRKKHLSAFVFSDDSDLDAVDEPPTKRTRYSDNE